MEQLFKDLISQHDKGRIKKADFEKALFDLINRHTQTVVQNALENERQLFLKDLYSKLIQKYQKDLKDNSVASSEKYFEVAYIIADKAYQYYNQQREKEYAAYLEQQKQQQAPVPSAENDQGQTDS